MRVTKKLLLGSVVATAALVLAACAPQAAAPGGDASETPSGPAEVTVGIVTSETGPLASYGKQYLDGFKAGLDYATDGTGEIDGTTITVEYKDDAGDPDKAVTAVKELIGAGVNIIGGSASSGVALAVAEQAAQNKVLFVSGPAAADAITGINEYTFRSGRQSAQDVATAGTFLDDLEGKTITVFAQNSAFGQGNEAAVKAILGAKGATVNSVLVAEDVTEFTPFAQQVLASDPDLVFVAWAGATSGAMWQAMSQQGVLDEIPVVTGLGDSATFAAYGEASEKISFLNHYFPGANDNDVNADDDRPDRRRRRHARPVQPGRLQRGDHDRPRHPGGQGRCRRDDRGPRGLRVRRPQGRDDRARERPRPDPGDVPGQARRRR